MITLKNPLKNPDDRRKTLRRAMGRAAAVSVVSLLLAGCSKERMETRREIARIHDTAGRTAEDRAVSGISEKYGIKASAEGYWVQAYDDFFAPYVSSHVVVFMKYGDRKFCAGIDTDDETVFWDNYRREEIDAVLQEYLMELYTLPRPYRAETVFRLKDAPNCLVSVPLEWREKGYDHANMVDFCFDGQTAEELLAKIEYLEYHDAYLSAERFLGSVTFRAEDWPICDDGHIEWHMRLYTSPEAEFADRSTESPDVAGYRYFREWRQACLSHKGTEREELSGESFDFHSLEAEGITVTSRLPCDIEDIIEIREGETKWSAGRGEDDARTYRLVSSVFEVTEGAPDSYYATVMYVPADFTERYESPLYILCRNKETGEVNVRASVLSGEELEALPKEGHDRAYKIYANGTCGMSAGYQYAVAEKY